MSEQQPPFGAPPAPPAGSPAASPAGPAGSPAGPAVSSMADGEWHRMHPLTPLFKGGLALIVVAGIVFANMRDRVIAWIVGIFAPEEADYGDYTGGDPVDWVLANNLVLVALLVVLGVLIVLVLAFWFVWRFQQFRITGEHVEVRKGIVFRSHRRAPLDRVQGVNLTRPFPARIIGLAKLEVVGAGTDANVPLEYLATGKAEEVRADILRLASGARAAREAASGRRSTDAAAGASATGLPGAGPATVRSQLVGSVNAGVTGLIEGVDLADVAPESVVKIPAGRLIGSQLVAGVLWLVFFGLIFAIAMISALIGAIADGEAAVGVLGVGLGFGMGIPMVLAAVGITWARISKSLRYAIAPTPDGVRITYGLLTTVTETLPPGRIFAVEVSQSLVWRPFGWWTIKINRMSGKSASQQQSGNAQQFNIVLPVGKRADVERVLALILPDAPVADIPLVWEHGILGPVAGDPYRTIPGRAWWRRPLSWKRHGYALTEFGVLVRRGTIWRKLAIFPLARLQGLSLSQGPIDRAQRVSHAQVHTVPGPITGALSGLERDDAIALLDRVSRAAAEAASRDHTHRWGEHAPQAVAVADGQDAAAGAFAPGQPDAAAGAFAPGFAVGPPPAAPYASPVTPPPAPPVASSAPSAVHPPAPPAPPVASSAPSAVHPPAPVPPAAIAPPAPPAAALPAPPAAAPSAAPAAVPPVAPPVAVPPVAEPPVPPAPAAVPSVAPPAAAPSFAAPSAPPTEAPPVDAPPLPPAGDAPSPAAPPAPPAAPQE